MFSLTNKDWNDMYQIYHIFTILKWRFSLTKLLDILPYLTRFSMILLRHSALSALDLDANHGAGRCTHTFTPNTWPSFVGKYSSTMVRIWVSRTVGSIFGDAQTIIGWLKHDGRDWLLKLKSQLVKRILDLWRSKVADRLFTFPTIGTFLMVLWSSNLQKKTERKIWVEGLPRRLGWVETIASTTGKWPFLAWYHPVSNPANEQKLLFLVIEL